MANESISAGGPTPEIEVLFAGNIADDDMMWVVRCSVAELARLALAPVEWVRALGGLPSWSAVGGKSAPTLSRDFVLVAQPTDTSDPDDWVTVQGISGTNQLSVVSSRASAVLATSAVAPPPPGGKPFDAFWELVSSDPSNPPTLKKALPLNSILANSRLYLHFEILDLADTPDQRAERTVAFLLATILDPEGYAKMLNGLDQKPIVVEGGTVKPGKKIRLLPAALPSAVYANVEGAAPGSATPEADTLICNMADGPLNYVEGTGTAAGTVIKRYGIE